MLKFINYRINQKINIRILFPSKNQLKILYTQNDTQLRKLKPGEKLPYVSFVVPVNAQSISGYSALRKATVNIPDVYNMDEYIMYHRDYDYFQNEKYAKKSSKKAKR